MVADKKPVVIGDLIKFKYGNVGIVTSFYQEKKLRVALVRISDGKEGRIHIDDSNYTKDGYKVLFKAGTKFFDKAVRHCITKFHTGYEVANGIIVGRGRFTPQESLHIIIDREISDRSGVENTIKNIKIALIILEFFQYNDRA